MVVNHVNTVYLSISIYHQVTMSEQVQLGHIRVSDATKAELTKIAGELQAKSGKSQTLEDAIKYLVQEHKGRSK
jgi:hypothetical protein